ncbi:hypothetical protein MPSEU_000397600 [Mayamaea pseudoterrestris]|nr:hypothetical protein MPSEU_000397600 [Mayamaea pseudoterrestris]
MNRSEKRQAEQDSPVASNKRQRNARVIETRQPDGGNNGQYRSAVEISNSSMTSSTSSLAASLAGKQQQQQQQQHVSSGETASPQAPKGNVLEQLLGRHVSATTPASLPLDVNRLHGANATLTYAQQLQQAASAMQQPNAQIADLLSNQILMQRQRQLHEQLSSQDATTSYYLMLQQQQHQARLHAMLGNHNGVLASSGNASLGAQQAALLRNAGLLPGNDSLTGLNSNSLWDLISSREAQQQHASLQQQQQLLMQQQLQQQQQLLAQQGLKGALGLGGGLSTETSRMMEALMLEQQLLGANRSYAARGISLYPTDGLFRQQSMPMPVLTNQVSDNNPLSNMVAEASMRLARQQQQDAQARQGNIVAPEGSAAAREHRRNPSHSSLAMPPPSGESRDNNTKHINSKSMTNRKVIPMATPADKTTLSEYQCLVREQIIFFAASADDIHESVQGRNRPIVLGQVGIHCVRCWHEQHDRNRFIRQKPRGASYYPSKLSGIYQAAQNMVTNHFMDSCRSLPLDVKTKLAAPRSFNPTAEPMTHHNPPLIIKRGWSTSNAGGGKQYWANAAQKLGIVETEEHGLVFQNSSDEEVESTDAAATAGAVGTGGDKDEEKTLEQKTE